MITANLVSPDIIDVLYSLKFEKENTFRCGLGFASFSMVALQPGIIFDKIVSRYTQFRIGALPSYGVGSSLSKTCPGLESYVTYNFDIK